MDKAIATLKVNKKAIFHLLSLLIIVISLPILLSLIRQPQRFWSQAASGPDLDVTYIERTPRYYRYKVDYVNGLPVLSPIPGDPDQNPQNDKHWPEVGEIITYTVHLINKGTEAIAAGFTYQWLLDGNIVASGTSSSGIAAGQETTIQYQTAWPPSSHSVQFKVDPQNTLAETVETNNSLSTGSHDLTISIWVEQGLYDIFNQTLNLSGSYSFEDWIQAQFAKMNERFAQARYPVSPNGIVDRVRIDKVVVADNLDGSSSPMNSDPERYLIDGRWQFTDNDPTNTAGQGGVWQDYVNRFAGSIDWGLIHELAHQLGMIDLYRMNLANDPQNNNRFQVTDLSGQVIDSTKLSPVFRNPGIMAGGETSPYNDNSYFESHTAGGMNSHYNFRRGYYGEYLFDTPTQNYLKVFDALGNPLSGAQVGLYQKDPSSEIIDNTPEITGATNPEGIITLPNRTVDGTTTVTGHTLKDNPFGQINVVGTNGTMFVKVTDGAKESYHWLTITELNLTYWLGNRDSATYTIKTNIDPRNIDPTNQALNKLAASNRESVTGHEPAKAVDGDKTTAGNSWQVYGSLNPGDWWQVDLGTVLDLAQVVIYPNSQNYADWCDRFHIDVSTTGSFSGEEQRIVTETNTPHAQSILYIFPSTAARYVRVVNDQTQNWTQLQEFEVYGVSSSPTPTPTPTPSVTPTPVPTLTPTPTPILGDGLTGTYYNSQDLTGFSIARIDPTVNFDWGSSSPDLQIGVDNFSVRWTGKIMPKYSQNYTFYTRTDDGVRLWINDKLVIDRWSKPTIGEARGKITLTAGQKYNLKMEYYEKTGSAMAKLYWSSSSQTKEIIPQTQLFSN